MTVPFCPDVGGGADGGDGGPEGEPVRCTSAQPATNAAHAMATTSASSGTEELRPSSAGEVGIDNLDGFWKSKLLSGFDFSPSLTSKMRD